MIPHQRARLGEGAQRTGSDEPAGDSDASTARAQRSRRLALATFIAIEVIALPVLLYVGRHRWFLYDEWDFLASRGAENLRDLFLPHDVHWVTLPLLVYRAMWKMFGLNSYLPYQVLSVGTHLGVVGLIRAVMRRAGVRPWTATAAALLLVFFVAGDDNILGAFQITFTGAVAFGLIQLILADHDGPIDRRDWLGLAAGFAGLLCSGVAVTMVIIVGLAVLGRRGWRAAAFHTVPLGVVYGVWYLSIGNEGLARQGAGSPDSVLAFTRTAVASAFDGMAQVPFLGWALGALLVVGCFLAWRGLPLPELRRVASAPVALLLGVFVFLAITGIGRARGDELAHASRYAHIVATLSLPAIAIAADAIMVRWRLAAPVLAAGLVVALVGNVRLLDDDARQAAAEFQRVYKQNFLSWPRLPISSELPRRLHPDPAFAPWVTLGWLEDGVSSGRIPGPGAVDPVAAATNELTLALHLQRHRPASCAPVAAPADVRLEAGSSIKLAGPVSVVYRDAAGTRSAPVSYLPLRGREYLVAYAGPLDVRVETQPAGGSFELCDADGGPFVVPTAP